MVEMEQKEETRRSEVEDERRHEEGVYSFRLRLPSAFLSPFDEDRHLHPHHLFLLYLVVFPPAALPLHNPVHFLRFVLHFRRDGGRCECESIDSNAEK